MLRLGLLLAALVWLSGCISSHEPLFGDEPPATPLPGAFVLVGREGDRMEAWRVTLDAGVYRWEQEKGTSLVRFHPIDAAAGSAPARSGFHIATVTDEKNGAIQYGLVEVRPGSLAVFTFDPDERARAVGVAPDETQISFDTRFRNRDDLMRVMVDVAAKSPPDARSPYRDENGEVSFFVLEVHDLADPQGRAAGERLLAQARRADGR